MPHTVPTRARNNRLGVGVTLGLLSLIGAVTLGIIAYMSADRWVDHTVQVRHEVDDWAAALLEAETGVRGYVLSERASSLQPYHNALRRERRQAGLVRELVNDNPVQIHNVETAAEAALATMTGLSEMVTLVAAGHKDQVIARVASETEDTRPMNRFRTALENVRAEEERLLIQRRSSTHTRALATLGGETLLMLACGSLLGLAWIRERRHERVVHGIAVEARSNLAALTDIAAAFSEVRNRREVATAIVDRGMRAARADTCTLYVVDESGTELHLLAERGVAPALLATIRRLTERTDGAGLFEQLRSGAHTWVENEEQYAATFPALVSMKVEGRRAKAFWSVPLRVEGQVVGLLGMGFYEARSFTRGERAFVETYCTLCAQALQRATRLEREDEAQRWFTTTLRSIGDAVIATDADGKITFMNPVAETLTHWSAQDAKGRHLDEVFCIFSEDTHAAVESPVGKVLREGKVVSLANHTLLRSKHGVEFPIDDSGAPIFSDDGTLQGVVLVFRDARHQKQERVRREFLAKAGETLISSRDYEATLTTVAQLAVPSLADWCAVDMVQRETVYRQIAVAHVDPSKVRLAQQLAERYPPDPTATTGVPQVIRTGKSELYTEIPPALLEAGARDPEHLRIIRELRLHSAIVVPLHARGRILGAMTFVYAESGRRYSEDDLAFAEDFARRAAMAIDNSLALKDAEEARSHERILRTEAELASRAKDDFLATVSHELRTPLNAILGWTVILRRRNPTPDIDRSLVVIERNARAQAKLIEDVLDLSRIISGKLSLSVSPTNVGEIVASAIETVTPAAQAKGVTLSTDLGDRTVIIAADPDRLQQVIWNLLSNAVKFTPKGGKVSVSSRVEGSIVRLEVRDTGEGIRQDALPLIFEPFHQADASTTRRHGGLGLGLAIVKQLVVAHGGTVHAESDGLGHGATVVVQLPARALVAPLEGGRGRVVASSAEIPSPTTDGPRLEGLKVLVVDDEDDARTMVCELLREMGADVHPVGSAFEALDVVSTLRPDIIVSDIGMPGMDGYSMIRNLRSLTPEQGGRTTAVALTAYSRGEDAQRALAAGYQMHVAKPVEPGQLVRVIANLGGRPSAEAEGS